MAVREILVIISVTAEKKMVAGMSRQRFEAVYDSPTARGGRWIPMPRYRSVKKRVIKHGHDLRPNCYSGSGLVTVSDVIGGDKERAIKNSYLTEVRIFVLRVALKERIVVGYESEFIGESGYFGLTEYDEQERARTAGC